MKTKKISGLIGIVLFASSHLLTAQVNVTQYGQVSLGTTVAPPSSQINLFTYGDAMFSWSTSSSNSAPLIVAPAGSGGWSTPSAPDYTYWYDNYTGIYHPSTGVLGITANNTQVLTASQASSGIIQFYNGLTNNGTYPNVVVSNVKGTQSLTWVVDYYNGSTYSDNFYVYGAGYAWAYSYSIISDKRLKKNINNIHGALDKVLKLQGVTYNYNPATTYKDVTDRIQIGFVAQDVQKVVPEVVNMGKDSVLGIAYQNLVPLLVEAIKEQNKNIDSLRTQLNNCCNAGQLPTGFNGANNSGSSSASQAMLYQNVPNPFTQNTSITCYIPEQSNSASMMIFDMNGGLKTTLPITGKDNQNIVVNGGELAAGMYYYTLIIDGKEIDTKKMILTK